MEDSYYHYHRVDVERTDWPTTSELEEKRTSADACQKEFANHLMLLRAETLLVVNDKEKREQ